MSLSPGPSLHIACPAGLAGFLGSPQYLRPLTTTSWKCPAGHLGPNLSEGLRA